MKYLLDTHVLLWAAMDSSSLSSKARKLIEDAENELFFSAASLWEIVIKSNIGRKDFEVNPQVLRRNLVENGYNELAITTNHALSVSTLPLIHHDPFDRILIAQSIYEEITLLTHDKQVLKYKIAPIKAV